MYGFCVANSTISMIAYDSMIVNVYEEYEA